MTAVALQGVDLYYCHLDQVGGGVGGDLHEDRRQEAVWRHSDVWSGRVRWWEVGGAAPPWRGVRNRSLGSESCLLFEGNILGTARRGFCAAAVGPTGHRERLMTDCSDCMRWGLRRSRQISALELCVRCRRSDGAADSCAVASGGWLGGGRGVVDGGCWQDERASGVDVRGAGRSYAPGGGCTCDHAASMAGTAASDGAGRGASGSRRCDAERWLVVRGTSLGARPNRGGGMGSKFCCGHGRAVGGRELAAGAHAGAGAMGVVREERTRTGPEAGAPRARRWSGGSSADGTPWAGVARGQGGGGQGQHRSHREGSCCFVCRPGAAGGQSVGAAQGTESSGTVEGWPFDGGGGIRRGQRIPGQRTECSSAAGTVDCAGWRDGRRGGGGERGSRIGLEVASRLLRGSDTTALQRDGGAQRARGELWGLARLLLPSVQRATEGCAGAASRARFVFVGMAARHAAGGTRPGLQRGRTSAVAWVAVCMRAGAGSWLWRGAQERRMASHCR